MSIASQLTALANNKAAIKSAILAKNPTTAPTDVLSQWPTAIASIPTGGGPVQGYTLTVVGDPDIPDDPSDPYSLSDLLVFYSSGGCQIYNCWLDLVNVGSRTFNNVIGYQIIVGYYSYDNALPQMSQYYPLQSNTTINMKCACFLPGTQITMADGTTKSVEDITYDDLLAVWDFGKGEMASARPLWMTHGIADHKWHVALSTGTAIDITGTFGHRGFNLDREMFVNLPKSVGNRIWTANGEATVVSSERSNGAFQFYNIITDGHMNLFANGMLTSCSLNNYRSIDAKTMKWKGEPVVVNSADDFAFAPAGWIEGLHLLEQGMGADRAGAYVRNMMRRMTPRVFGEG